MENLQPDDMNGRSRESSVDTFQIRSVPSGRFVQGGGRVSDAMIEGIERALLIAHNIRLAP